MNTESIPDFVLEEILEMACGQCTNLQSHTDLVDYLFADEDALELALPYLDTSPL